MALASGLLKAAEAAIAAVTGFKARHRPRALTQLLKAKMESDRHRYEAKHSIMRDLIRDKPSDFHQDSEDKGIVGVTHHPTGFRMHLPKTVVPVTLKKLMEGP
jgi:hypothetical protein